MKKIMVGALLMALNAGAETPTLVNPSFNEDFKGWAKDLPGWTVETGMGFNGSKGLIYRGGCAVEKWIHQDVKLVPGKRYRFGCWMKRNAPKGSKSVPHFAIEWTDKNGKYFGGAYIRGSSKNDEWVKIEQITKEIPEGIGHANLLVYFDTQRYGAVNGEFAFDDFFLMEADIKPLTLATSSAYRNEIVGEGKVKFLAQVTCPLKVSKGEVRVAFGWKGTDGAMHERAGTLRGSVVDVEVDASEIAYGTNDVVVTAVGGDDGDARPNECRFQFARLEKPIARKTYIDRFGRCVKDGKLFFPHGMYFAKATDENLDIYTNSPFNVIMPYHRPTPEQMDSIARHKLLTFVSMQNEICTTSKAQYTRMLEKCYGRFRNHPAFFAWYIFDEAPANEAVNRIHSYEAVRDWDPDRICWAVFCNEGVIPDFMTAMDVIGVDPYPVGNNLQLSDVAKFCRRVHEHTHDMFPMWNVPQAFDWGNYRKNQPTEHRMPTKEELRNMNWQHIACGANGLISYSFFDIQRQANAKADWQVTREVAYEIDKYVPVILSEPGPKVTAPKSILVRTWKKDGKVWVLAVNPSETEVKCEVEIEGCGHRTYQLGRYAVSID